MPYGLPFRGRLEPINCTPDLASIANNQQAKELFERLAIEESKHKMRLENLYDEDILKKN